MINPDRAYSLTEAAEFLGLCTKQLRGLVASGEFGTEAFAHKNADGKAVNAYRITGAGIRAYRARHTIRA